MFAKKAFFNKENEMKTVSGNKLSVCHAYAYYTYWNLLFVSNIISKTTSSVSTLANVHQYRMSIG